MSQSKHLVAAARPPRAHALQQGDSIKLGSLGPWLLSQAQRPLPANRGHLALVRNQTCFRLLKIALEAKCYTFSPDEPTLLPSSL